MDVNLAFEILQQIKWQDPPLFNSHFLVWAGASDGIWAEVSDYVISETTVSPDPFHQFQKSSGFCALLLASASAARGSVCVSEMRLPGYPPRPG